MSLNELVDCTLHPIDLKATVNAFVGFFSDDSAPSRVARAVFETFSATRTCFWVDIQQRPVLARHFAARAIPTVVHVKQGHLVHLFVGAPPAGGYEQVFAEKTEPKRPRARHRVRVYSTDDCPWCTRLKGYLKQHSIRFEDINVQKDVRVFIEMVQRSGERGVPQLDIDGQRVVGFDKPKIDVLLGL